MKQENNLEYLKKFISDIDDDFAKIEAESDKVNIFNILKLENYEIRHSSFLAWLLNPNETHKLNDYFLKKILKDILKLSNTESISLFDIEQMDLMKSEIKREWRNIDILILNENSKFVCVIENKVYSKESSGQTKKYKEIIEEEFPTYNKLFVLLSIEGFEAEEYETYIPYKYENIYHILKLVQQNKSESMNEITNIFIKNYLDVLNNKMIEDSDIKKICQEIYKKHQKALDLIIEHKPDRELEIHKIIEEILEELVKEGKNLVIDQHSKYYLRFAPREFENIDYLKQCEIWTFSKKNLLFEIKINPEKLELDLVLSNKETIPIFWDEFNKFMKKQSNSKKWITYKLSTLLSKDYKEKDDEDLKKEIKEKLTNFIESNKYKEIIENVKRIINELN